MLRFCVAVVLALHAQGLPLLLQQVGWVNMVVRYSAEGGVVQGVRETFDGTRPCAFCHAAADAQKEDEETPQKNRRDEALQPPLWRVVQNDDAVVVPAAKDAGLAFVEPLWSDGCGRGRPDVPPPRFARV
ncbi:hypothetical protein [Sulfuriroseicoccus oceanibius]|uniref:Uncharacterized protein n=1 Tax=Sulfuriroseicoccus oceanibius TaxID=2707525 RepID=A0A6B3L682_9BACT|nr:hypothetical protein [Sulfuriroseicoccus oceanibius]QQL44675.1 hypothetical protein G3M56_012415 [Sulfuriroseicoccus oceanibius]